MLIIWKKIILMIKKLYLCNELLIARGGERACYSHPLDKNCIIKVTEKTIEDNKQNLLEYKYYLYLKNKKVNFLNIARCFGWTETNLGQGLIFQKILDYNLEVSKSFRFYLRNNILSKIEEKRLLKELEIYLCENKILFIDVSTVNVLCQKLSKDKYKLIIIDGLGARRLNYKFYMYLYIPFLAKYKIKKQWKKFMFNYKRDKKFNLIN